MVSTNQNTELEKFTASGSISELDIVYMSGDNTVSKNSTNENSKAVGVAYESASDGDKVSVLVRGVVHNAHVLVQNTSGSSGYDNPLNVGDQVLVGGNSGASRGDGQYFVAVGGTGQGTADATTIVGKALEAETGTSGSDTTSQRAIFVNFV